MNCEDIQLGSLSIQIRISISSMGLCIEDNLGFADNKFLWGIHQCIELTAINKEPCMLHKYLVNLSIFGIFRHKEHKHYLYNQDKFLQGRFLSIILQRRSQ